MFCNAISRYYSFRFGLNSIALNHMQIPFFFLKNSIIFPLMKAFSQGKTAAGFHSRGGTAGERPAAAA